MDNDALRAKIAREEEELKDAIQAGLLKKFSPEWKSAQDNINADKQLLIQQQGEPSLSITPCIVSRRPMHASESPRGASHELLRNIPKDRPHNPSLWTASL